MPPDAMLIIKSSLHEQIVNYCSGETIVAKCSQSSALPPDASFRPWFDERLVSPSWFLG